MSKEHDKLAGAYLQALRLGAGLTQEQAAAKSGLSAIFISVIENGKQRPSIRSLNKLARAYGANLKELLERFGYPPYSLVPPHSISISSVSYSTGPTVTPRRVDLPEEQRLDWALKAISSDYEYSLAPDWESQPYLTKALLVRIYQSETGRRLLRDDEMAAVHGLVHGGEAKDKSEAAL